MTAFTLPERRSGWRGVSCKDKGVPIGEAVQREMIAVRDQLKLPYHFDFEAAI